MKTCQSSQWLLWSSLAGCVYSSSFSRNIYTASAASAASSASSAFAAFATARTASFRLCRNRCSSSWVVDGATPRRLCFLLHPAAGLLLRESGARRLFYTRKSNCLQLDHINTFKSHWLLPHSLSSPPSPPRPSPWGIRHVTATSRGTTIRASSSSSSLSSTPQENQQQQQQQLESASEYSDDNNVNTARWEAMYNQGASSTLASASKRFEKETVLSNI